MKIVIADYILTMDKNDTIIRNGAVVFDKKIIEVGSDINKIKDKYKDCTVIDWGKNSVIMPGIVNPHVHLEFSGNKTLLEYGNFIGWLGSVMEKRQQIIESCDESCYTKAINTMLKHGVTSFGAISSYGYEIKACKDAPQRVVFFNELIGSNPASADVLFEDFKERVRACEEYCDDKFISAIAIHSPYSVHPVLIEKGLEIAKRHSMKVTAHFMESLSERKWLDDGSGEFKHFFKKYLNTSTPVTDVQRFLNSFKECMPIFVHCTNLNDKEFQKIYDLGGSIVHCPISNRLLGSKTLDLEKVKNNEIPFMIATDGLSSNYSLNMFNELRTALLIHTDLDLELLARDLLRSVTVVASNILGLNCGEISPNKEADLILFKLPDSVESNSHLPIQIILHTNEVDKVIIKGEVVHGEY